MSSLAFLAFGLRTPGGLIGTLQLPVAALQVYFIVAVALQVGVQGLVAPLTNTQRSLIGTLIVYVIFVSATSPVPSAHILAISWIIHILFFVALISFFRNVDLNGVEIVWSVLGLTALIHVSAFMIAWTIWPDEIRQMNLPSVGHIRHLPYILTPAATVMAVQFITRLDKGYSSIAFFAAAAFFIIYTGSRGGAAGVIVGLLAAGAYSAWSHQCIPFRRVLTLLGVTTVLVVAAELLPPLPWGTLAGRWLDAFSETAPEFSSARNEVWRIAMKAIVENWIWGYGPALLYEIPHQLPWPDRLPHLFQPHNVGLQLLLHWGALGTLVLALTILSFVANIWAALRQRQALSVMPLAVLVAMLTQALVDGNLFYPFSVVIAIIAFAILEGIGRQQSSESTSAA